VACIFRKVSLYVCSCKYEGVRCSHVNFSKDVTDYGLCYTFNSEQQLESSKTGLSFFTM